MTLVCEVHINSFVTYMLQEKAASIPGSVKWLVLCHKQTILLTDRAITLAPAAHVCTE